MVDALFQLTLPGSDERQVLITSGLRSTTAEFLPFTQRHQTGDTEEGHMHLLHIWACAVGHSPFQRHWVQIFSGALLFRCC